MFLPSAEHDGKIGLNPRPAGLDFVTLRYVCVYACICTQSRYLNCNRYPPAQRPCCGCEALDSRDAGAPEMLLTGKEEEETEEEEKV